MSKGTFFSMMGLQNFNELFEEVWLAQLWCAQELFTSMDTYKVGSICCTFVSIKIPRITLVWFKGVTFFLLLRILLFLKVFSSEKDEMCGFGFVCSKNVRRKSEKPFNQYCMDLTRMNDCLMKPACNFLFF